MKRIVLMFLILLTGSLFSQTNTLKFSFFDNDDRSLFQTYLAEQDITYTYELPSEGRIKVRGDFNEYDIARMKSANQLINNGLDPNFFKTKDLIYLEIYIGLNGQMDNIALALKDMQLFPIYLDSFNYDGARDIINKASKYLTLKEKNIILSVIP